MQTKRARGRPRMIDRNSDHPLYSTWVQMRSRCNNPKNDRYGDYGQRGITVCDRWSTFRNFAEDMHPKPDRFHSLERRDNDGPYSPDNCSWELPLVQHNNKRSNRLITHNGKTQTLSEWARETGIDYNLLWNRLKRMELAAAIAEGIYPENPGSRRHGKVTYKMYDL